MPLSEFFGRVPSWGVERMGEWLIVVGVDIVRLCVRCLRKSAFWDCGDYIFGRWGDDWVNGIYFYGSVMHAFNDDIAYFSYNIGIPDVTLLLINENFSFYLHFSQNRRASARYTFSKMQMKF